MSPSPDSHRYSPTPAPIIPLQAAKPPLTEKLSGDFKVVTVSVIPDHNPRVLLIVPPTPASLPAGKRYTAQ